MKYIHKKLRSVLRPYCQKEMEFYYRTHNRTYKNLPRRLEIMKNYAYKGYSIVDSFRFRGVIRDKN